MTRENYQNKMQKKPSEQFPEHHLLRKKSMLCVESVFEDAELVFQELN